MSENTGMTQPVADEQVVKTAAADRFVVDPTVSRFTVKVTASGLLSAFGHSPTIAIRDMKGEVHFSPATMEQSSLHITVAANSLAVTDNVNDKDRREIETEMRGRVLEVDKYPEITYETSRVSVKNPSNDQNDIVLAGKLTLHGVTRPQQIPARIFVTGDVLRASGEFTLFQTAYNIKPVSAAGGGLKVKDELKLAFDILARRPQ